MENYIIPTLHDLDLMDLAVGNRYFCLAHFYVQYEKYREFFKKKKAEGAFVTLDNSAAEKFLVTEDILIKVVRDLKPDEVIAPDVLFDYKQTIENLDKFIERMKNENLLKHTKIFACPQGKSKFEWEECYSYMVEHEDVSVIGMSKISVPKCWGNIDEEDAGIMESRQNAIVSLEYGNLIKKPIHFLGMGDPREFFAYKHNKLLRSTDSCYSVLAGKHNILFDEGNFDRIKTYNEFYDFKLTENETSNVRRNINFLNKIVSGKSNKIGNNLDIIEVFSNDSEECKTFIKKMKSKNMKFKLIDELVRTLNKEVPSLKVNGVILSKKNSKDFIHNY